jgi:hypothetical protein
VTQFDLALGQHPPTIWPLTPIPPEQRRNISTDAHPFQTPDHSLCSLDYRTSSSLRVCQQSVSCVAPEAMKKHAKKAMFSFGFSFQIAIASKVQ